LQWTSASFVGRTVPPASKCRCAIRFASLIAVWIGESVGEPNILSKPSISALLRYEGVSETLQRVQLRSRECLKIDFLMQQLDRTVGVA
jgi:hypothetical protein